MYFWKGHHQNPQKSPKPQTLKLLKPPEALKPSHCGHTNFRLHVRRADPDTDVRQPWVLGFKGLRLRGLRVKGLKGLGSKGLEV